MLIWLDQEFLAPTTILGDEGSSQLAVVGTVEWAFPGWLADLSDKTVGPTQVTLIKFFSQCDHNLMLLPATASQLLKDFQKHHGSRSISAQHDC
ncbi:hypothetical protein MJO28_014080 [Puccinia striiformis f. sp. tritici]|uniref:Uncharacterized protein n=1 Tax=Puccinia striiformis f. sp. tritici TaxID=168172 RepID=A0ACC0DW60_9BASI|nr:hypothetical protein MJO28_014080 [Puccinia striiformis f. sp. tritici]